MSGLGVFYGKEVTRPLLRGEQQWMTTLVVSELTDIDVVVIVIILILGLSVCLVLLS